MTKQRKPFNIIFNAVMTALMALPAMIMIQKMLLHTWEPWSGVLMLLPCVLLYPLGLLVRDKEPQLALVIGAGGAIATTLPLILAASGMYFEFIFVVFVLPIAAFALFSVPYVSGFNLLKPQIFIAGLGMYVMCPIIGGTHADSYAAVLNFCAPVFLVAGLFVFNRASLRKATSPSGGKTRFSPGMVRNNTIILGIFVAIAMVIANLQKVKDGAYGLVIWFVDMVFNIFSKLGDMLGYGEEVGGEIGSGGGGMFADLAPEDIPETPFWSAFWNVLSIVLVVALGSLLLFFLIRLIRKLLSVLPGFMSRLMDNLRPEADEYIDETENLEKERFRRGTALRRFFSNLRRKPGFDDMPNGRAKVRFVYRKVLRDTHAETTLTPNEFAPTISDWSARGGDFVAAYNKVRYAGNEVDGDDLDAARQVLNDLSGRR